MTRNNLYSRYDPSVKGYGQTNEFMVAWLTKQMHESLTSFM